MTDWKRAWQLRKKTRSAAKHKRTLKRHNHRANRLAAKALERGHVRLDGWAVI
jgi:hypothetical protein